MTLPGANSVASLKRQQSCDQALSKVHMASMVTFAFLEADNRNVAESSSHCLSEACLPFSDEHAGIPEQDTPTSTVQAFPTCEGCKRCQTVQPAAVQAVKMQAQLEWA